MSQRGDPPVNKTLALDQSRTTARKLLSRLPTKRWILLPTCRYFAQASNSLCEVGNISFSNLFAIYTYNGFIAYNNHSKAAGLKGQKIQEFVNRYQTLVGGIESTRIVYRDDNGQEKRITLHFFYRGDKRPNDQPHPIFTSKTEQQPNPPATPTVTEQASQSRRRRRSFGLQTQQAIKNARRRYEYDYHELCLPRAVQKLPLVPKTPGLDASHDFCIVGVPPSNKPPAFDTPSTMPDTASPHKEPSESADPGMISAKKILFPSAEARGHDGVDHHNDLEVSWVIDKLGNPALFKYTAPSHLTNNISEMVSQTTTLSHPSNQTNEQERGADNNDDNDDNRENFSISEIELGAIDTQESQESNITLDLHDEDDGESMDWRARASMSENMPTIDFVKTLDFSRPERMNRHGEKALPTACNNDFNGEQRLLALHYAFEWGWKEASSTNQRKIAEAACRLVAFDSGMRRAPKGTTLCAWVDDLHLMMRGEGSKRTGRGRKVESSYCDTMERNHPGYLHWLYRQADREISDKASFSELAYEMEKISARAGDRGPVVSLSRDMLRRWFRKWKGKQKASVIKPLLNEDKRTRRIAWVKKMAELVAPGDIPVAFLDEKWFYTRNRRKKRKFLPLHPTETEADLTNQTEHEASRRFPTKVMYLGVVAAPNPEHEFDGKVFLRRVSEEKTYSRLTHVSGIVDEYRKNAGIHKEWHRIFDDAANDNNDENATNNNDNNAADADADADVNSNDLTGQEVINKICEHYNLPEYTKDKLALRYSYTTRGGNTSVKSCNKTKKISDHVTRAGNNPQHLSIEGLTLAIFRNSGDTYEHDCSCDSVFMLRTMGDVAAALREKMSWVPADRPIYLVMDNAGGHGTKEAVKQYTDDVKRVHNVIIIQQVPSSPETNTLDLGVWCALQSAVEKYHRKKTKSDVDALARTIEYVWSNHFGEAIMKKVHDRWHNVLKIIEVDKGNNVKVDEFRGKKGQLLLTQLMININEDGEEEVVEDENEEMDLVW